MSARTEEIIARLRALDAERRQVMKLMQAPVFRDTRQQSHLERLLIGLQLEMEGLSAQLRVYEEADRTYAVGVQVNGTVHTLINHAFDDAVVQVKRRRTGRKR